MDVRVISLNVMPTQASMLSFEVGGIIEQINIELGSEVDAFDFPVFYRALGAMPTIPKDPARMYNVLEIGGMINRYILATLRAEPSKAALTKALNSRANSFYAKYANASEIADYTWKAYHGSVKGSKHQFLDALKNISQYSFDTINEQYKNDYEIRGMSPIPDRRREMRFHTEFFNGDDISKPPDQISVQYETHMVGHGHDYFMPAQENYAQYQRQQISLIDEKFDLYMKNQNLPYLEKVFEYELNSIDNDVYRAQIAYLNTILMSPISGVVTAIYKKVGEAVQPAEPVFRVENNNNVYLSATLVYRGVISLNSRVSVVTMLFDIDKIEIEGKVVSARCNDTDDQWNIIVKCQNTKPSGAIILPLNYRFDFDRTYVTIV
ncbi:MAG: HlyD family secretion protein [Xanthobacteraceae bacterium]